MNADNTHPDSLSEKVLGAVFEVANTLCRIPGKGLPAGPATGTRPPRHAGYRRSFICCNLQGAFGRRILCRSPGRRRAGSGVEMCRTPGKPTHRPMSQLSACLWPDRASASPFSAAQSRVAANRAWVCRGASDTAAGNSGLDQADRTPCPVNSWTLHQERTGV